MVQSTARGTPSAHASHSRRRRRSPFEQYYESRRKKGPKKKKSSNAKQEKKIVKWKATCLSENKVAVKPKILFHADLKLPRVNIKTSILLDLYFICLLYLYWEMAGKRELTYGYVPKSMSRRAAFAPSMSTFLPSSILASSSLRLRFASAVQIPCSATHTREPEGIIHVAITSEDFFSWSDAWRFL